MTANTGRITSIVQDNKNRYRYHIYVDDQYAFEVHEDILVKYALHKGKELDSYQLAELLAEEERNKAYLHALRYLGIRPRTAAQLESYLKDKGYTEELAAQTRQRCQQQGYIDDKAFASQWVRERIVSKSRSLMALRMELRQKGVAEEDIQDATSQVKQSDQLEAAVRLLAKKVRNRTSPLDFEERQKLSAMLLRKGFALEIIRQAIQTVQNGDTEC